MFEFLAKIKDAAPTAFSSHYRPTTPEWSKELHQLVRDHHWIHAVCFTIYWCASTGALPGGVLVDVAEYVTVKVIETLIVDLHLPEDLVGVRHKDNIVAWCRALCVFRVAFMLLATTHGIDYLHRRGVTPLSPEAMVEFCYPNLYVIVADVVFALTVLEFQFDSSSERDLLLLLASENFFSAHDDLMRKPLKVWRSSAPSLFPPSPLLDLRE
jgi:hypothetical protein